MTATAGDIVGDAAVRAGALRQAWDGLVAQAGPLRTRDAAARLGVAEGDLVASLVGQRATRLRTQGAAIVERLGALGRVMALTRNAHCVIERIGVYENVSIVPSGGLVLGPDIDLRLFPRHWHETFAVVDDTETGPRRSLQVFDASGTAIHKVYQRDETDLAAFDELIAAWRDTDQVPVFRHGASPLPPPPSGPAPAPADAERLRREWAALQDTHDFHPMLRRLGLARHAALRQVGAPYARPVSAGALALCLEQARDARLPVMVFVGNPGCIEIHTGPVHRLVRHGPWFNVLDADFNLHLREDAIAAAWIVRKPTRDGIVTSLELYDAGDVCFAQLFGARKPGQAELPGWTDIAAAAR